MEELLWNNIELVPWFTGTGYNVIEKNNKEKRIYIIKQMMLLRERGESLNNNSMEVAGKYSVNPELLCDCTEASLCFLEEIHNLVCKENIVYFCLGLRNRKLKGQPRTFQCECHPELSQPIVINDPEEWWREKINIIEEYWPQNAYDDDKLIVALQLYSVTHFNDFNGIFKFKNIEFSKKFLKKISQVDCYKEEILKQMSKRLMMTNLEAARDNSLSSESFGGCDTFRVTENNRIGYNLLNDNTLRFEEYFEDHKKYERH